MKKVIIVGATSGIGREMARLYADAGWLVGATGRRQELLYSLRLEYPNTIITECFDVTGPGATAHLESLTRKLGGLDLLVYSAGWGEIIEGLDWAIDKGTVDVNVNGFLETIHYGWKLFTDQGHGNHLMNFPEPCAKFRLRLMDSNANSNGCSCIKMQTATQQGRIP